MNNDIIFFCLSKLIMSYSFSLKALGFNVKDKDKDKPRPRDIDKKMVGRRGKKQEM